jgi:hypothetical protein
MLHLSAGIVSSDDSSQFKQGDMFYRNFYYLFIYFLEYVLILFLHLASKITEFQLALTLTLTS